MDINRLHYFCTVAQTGSISKASELLHISQPALSKAIKTLEAELDRKLIIASGRGISITDEGKSLAIKAFPLIEKINNLKEPKNYKPYGKELSVVTFEVFSTYFLGQVIAETFNDFSVSIFEMVPGNMEEAIIKGVADIGITYLPIPSPELDILKINSINMGVFGLKAKFKNLKFADLPFVVPNIPVSGTPSKAKGLDGWPDHIIPRKILYKVSMMETALELCRQGKCVGYFPDFVVKLHNEKVKLKYNLDKLSQPQSRNLQKQEVYMIKRKSDLESSNFKKISRAIRLVVK